MFFFVSCGFSCTKLKHTNTKRVKLTPGIKNIIKWRLQLPLCFLSKQAQTAKWKNNTTYPKAPSEGLWGALLAHLLTICGGHHPLFHSFTLSFISFWFPRACVTGSITWCPRTHRVRSWSASLDCAPSNQLVFCHVCSEIHQAVKLLQINNLSKGPQSRWNHFLIHL